MRQAASLSIKTGITLFWVDRNHENHDAIHTMIDGTDGAVYMTGDVWYIPRGVALDIDGRTIVGYGGAVSIDRTRRVPGHSWWDREAINEYHVASLAYNFPVDILVTHEAPGSEHLSYKDDMYRRGVDDVWAESRRQRELVTEIQRITNPTVHVCGHHHVRKTWMERSTTVHVLNCNGSEEESVVLL